MRGCISRHITLKAILFLLLSVQLTGQGLTDSNLPIVIINTDGSLAIPDEPKIKATMKIIDRGAGQRNYVSDQNNPLYLNYNGRIGIELRGSSSQESPKKNYGFTTRMADDASNNNVSLLGMPEENDWILGGMVFDTAFIRDYYCHNLYRQMGNYGSRAAYCEVIVNNVYMGLYMLQEKLKADDNRIDVIKIGKNDNSLPSLTGGYISKADKRTGGDPLAWRMYSFQNSEVEYIHELPKPEDATSQQTAYISGEFFRLESAAHNNDISVVNGYPALIDIPSFIDFMIVNEFASNPDAYQYSTFFHKDRNGKLRAGPVWDIDLSFGNDLFQWYMDRSKTYLWYFEDYYYNNGSRFWRDLFHNSTYRCYLSRRWNELLQPDMPLNRAVREAFLDETVALISEAVARDCQRWNKSANHTARIEAIKTFMQAREEWITANIGGYSLCSNVAVPQLTITKIMYHPQTSTQFPDGDDLEFIEIRNTGTTTVNLSGIYFMGTGLVYQFPANATLGPGLCVILASNATVFQLQHGFSPFGQFTRHLSNNSEKILLADAFGNLIDLVEYSDSSPWPAADGNGAYLRLKDHRLDNSVAENWEASSDVITAVDELHQDPEITLYPNPVHEMLTVRSGSGISSICVYDLRGSIILTLEGSGNEVSVDMSPMKPGIYIVRIFTRVGSFPRRVIKE
ncbi:MAG TPA: CotH kinase family protein [Bacteroidales bacterium]|nr:CotH kinase family protein [Bacteroidales bacterium]HPJ04628.1 CotH kinase family protein [Bacteroidales bacterium]HPQ63395.1 CotH kinase family protein [Bacteroidales bacterium]